MAGWGGKRTRAGRPPSVYKTREIAKRLALRALEDPSQLSEMPLDFLIRVMRDEEQPIGLRIDCAKSAAPFVHAKLQSIDLTSQEDRTVRIEFVDFSRSAILNSPSNNQVIETIASKAITAAVVDDDED